MTLTRTSRRGAGLILLAPTVTLAMLAINGTLSTATAPGPFDSPVYAAYALPINRVLRDLSLAVTIGCLVLAASLPSSSTGPTQVVLVRRHLVGIARLSALAWVLAASIDLVLTFTEVAGVDVWTSGGLEEFGVFITELPSGRNLLEHAIGALVVSVGSFFVVTETGAFIMAMLAVSALWPLGTTGHAAGDSGHLIAVYAQVAHMAGVSVWFGGLVALTLVRKDATSRRAIPLIGRYSSLAGFSAILVGISGTAAAWLRVGSWEGLSTAYGLLVIAKSAAFCLLLSAGYVHRRRLIPAFDTETGASPAFWRLVSGELVVMALAVGLAVALSRTATP